MYEMLSGQLPFKGDYEQAMVYSIINEEPLPVNVLNEDISVELETIVMKCLAKNADERYSTIDELLIDFKPFSHEAAVSVDESIAGILKRLWRKKKVRRICTISAAATVMVSVLLYFWLILASDQTESLAILPFENTNGDQELEHLCMGIPQSIISDLQKIPNLQLAPFSSLRYRYGNKPREASIVSTEMRVKLVATGRLSLQENNVIVYIEIIDGVENRSLLTKEYHRERWHEDEPETEIARDIADHLRLELSDEEKSKYLERSKVEGLAYDFYLKGQKFWDKYNPEGDRMAIIYFKRALAIDPTFALAWAGLAETYAQQVNTTGLPRNMLRSKFMKAGKKAFELDSTLKETRTTLAAVYSWDGKYNKAIKELKKAIEIDPNYLFSYQRLGSLLGWRIGNYEEGENLEQH